ncbi:MAG: protein-L-isoaspartate(D-aspartate) O-methyltransferase [Micropepsaceae bacterium]
MDGVTEARRAFANSMGVASRAPGGRVAEAFAMIPRENFLGIGPWLIFTYPKHYAPTATDNPTEIYRDVAVGLIPEKSINNGQPSLHAFCIGLLDPKAHESVVHIGAGSGYYTAILAHLVNDGAVHAYEIEPELADRARRNLGHLSNVHVHATSGANGSLPMCDVMYVNAGATHPLDSWLDAMRTGGRLMFPLTSENLTGGMALVAPATKDVFSARIVIPVGFIPCAGARDSTVSSGLEDAFTNGNWRSVRSLRRGGAPDESCWFAAKDCWFSTREVTDC